MGSGSIDRIEETIDLCKGKSSNSERLNVNQSEPGRSANTQKLKNHLKGGFLIGGGGGNRTRVRKSSTGSSTYLAMLFNLTWHTSTGGLMTGESPIF